MQVKRVTIILVTDASVKLTETKLLIHITNTYSQSLGIFDQWWTKGQTKSGVDLTKQYLI